MHNMEYLTKCIKELRLFFTRSFANKICDCGDDQCKREVKSTKEGRLYVVNHFTCGKVKKFINDYKDVKFS